MSAWAHGGTDGIEEAEPASDDPAEEPAAVFAQVIEEPGDGETTWDEPAAETIEPAYAEAMEEDEFEHAATSAEFDSPTAPTLVQAVEDVEVDDDVPAEPPLRLRPRTHDDDGKRLDWSFGPRGWDESDDPAGVESGPLNGDDDSLTAMRAWAERNKDADHPHFVTEHRPEAEVAEELPPLPLRPLHRDEAETPPVNLNAAPPILDGPRDLPLVRRSHTEPEPSRDPSQGATKWDEFFNLNPGAEPGAEGEEAPAGLSEGLSAMRDWAKTRPEAGKERDIPEEFLKPFDWETEEDGAPADLTPPDELLKPFDWEAQDDDTEETGYDTPTALAGPATPVEEGEAPPAGFAPEAFADDPLEDIFQRPAEAPAPAPQEKKGGFMGRLFGRKKKHEPIAITDEDDTGAGDWIIPGDEPDEDVRNVAAHGLANEDPGEDENDEAEWTIGASSVFATGSARPAARGWGGNFSSEDEDAFSDFASELHDPEVADEPSGIFNIESEVELDTELDDADNAAVPVALERSVPLADAEDDDAWSPEPVPARGGG